MMPFGLLSLMPLAVISSVQNLPLDMALSYCHSLGTVSLDLRMTSESCSIGHLGRSLSRFEMISRQNNLHCSYAPSEAGCGRALFYEN